MGRKFLRILSFATIKIIFCTKTCKNRENHYFQFNFEDTLFQHLQRKDGSLS